LKDNRIVIPKSLQQRILDLAHETHQGVVKTKLMLREKVWWPGIDLEIEELIKNCIPCISVTPSTHTEPLKPNPMTKPWEKVHIDIYGPLPTNDYILGIIDAGSRWPDLHIIRSTTSDTIIKCLDRTFATHGYPEVMVSDNAPNLTSSEIDNYCILSGIKHQKITPYRPQGNAEIERFYRTLGKAIRTVHVDGGNWKIEINKFLLTYRNTPHCTTNVSPAKLLMGHSLRDKLPLYLPIITYNITF